MEAEIIELIRYHAISQLITEKGSVNLDEVEKGFEDFPEEIRPTRDILANDLESLISSPQSFYNIPLKYNKERNSYYFGDPSFSIFKQTLNSNEIKILRIIAIYFDKIKNHQTLSGLKGLMQKMIDSLQIREEDENLSLPDFVDTEHTADFTGSKFIAPIIKAIKNKKVLRIYYMPFYEDKPYFTIVHPYLLKEFKGRWYLIGLNETKNEIRTYGLDRIWEIGETDNAYIPKKFSASDYFKNSVGVISPFGEPEQIHIEVSVHQAKYLITQPLHNSQYIEEEKEDSVVFSYKLHPTYEFKSMILGMGKEVKVLKPESFRRDIIHELNNAILAYGKNSF